MKYKTNILLTNGSTADLNQLMNFYARCTPILDKLGDRNVKLVKSKILNWSHL